MSTFTTSAPELEAITFPSTTRAEFLMRATLAAGAVYGTAAVGPFVTQALARVSRGDIDILNYALTLERLEAAFYTKAVQKVSGLSADVKALAMELRDNEQEHAEALSASIRQLNAKPTRTPKVDFANAFSSEAAFLKTANTFEDLGVSAYNGAAPMIVSDEILGAAGAIVQVEARHAALIRLARGKPPAPLAFDKPSSMAAVLKAAAPFIKG